jgi:predicted RNA binding protein YcfA (HicA-like mRNA interferase family)/predicted RNase H-like HicB family nuclease
MNVRQVFRRLGAIGWFRVRSKGGHRQFKHDLKTGRVTVSGKVNVDVPLKTLKSIWKQSAIAGDGLMRYAIVIEKGPTSFGAYVPDLPGCVAAAKTADEVKKLIAEAIPLHVEGLREDGLPIPAPETEFEYIEV